MTESSNAFLYLERNTTEAADVSFEAPSGFDESPAKFPYECIPKTLRDLGNAFSVAYGIPAEYVWVSGLPVLSAAIGRSCTVRVDAGWVDAPVIWAGISGESGSGKTPAIDIVSAPLNEIDIKRHHDYEKELARAEEQLKTDKYFPAPKPRHRLIVDDATTEALLRILSKTPRGLLLKSEELVKVIAGLGQYKQGRGSDRQTMLSLWSGITTRVDRVGRGDDKTLLIEDPFISVLGGVQPSEVSTLLSGEDGMAQRWLLAHFPAQKRPKVRRVQMEPLPIELWRKLIFSLVSAEDHRELTLSSEALERWERLQDDYKDFANESISRGVSNFWGKLSVHTIRLAILIHVSRFTERDELVPAEIGDDSLFMAEMLGIYFARHFEAFTPKPKNLMAKFRDRDTDEVVDLIMDAARRMGGRITLSQIQRKHIGGIRTAEEAHLAAARCWKVYPGCLVPNERGGGKSVVVPDLV